MVFLKAKTVSLKTYGFLIAELLKKPMVFLKGLKTQRVFYRYGVPAKAGLKTQRVFYRLKSAIMKRFYASPILGIVEMV